MAASGLACHRIGTALIPEGTDRGFFPQLEIDGCFTQFPDMLLTETQLECCPADELLLVCIEGREPRKG